MNKLKIRNNKLFEDIKHVDENGCEFWYARELMPLLEYSKWENFHKVIKSSMIACTISNNAINEHFPEIRKLLKVGNNAKINVKDYKLSRYACYLIAQNGDPRKEVIALAQTYFAIQTRRQELSEMEYSLLSEDDKRLYVRNLTKKGNYSLSRTAIKSGVKDLKRFHNEGYKGLYNGETVDDIYKRKGLRYREDILDNMGSKELIANLFRISQTEDKLIKDKINTSEKANKTHYEVGKIVRNAIKEVGGTMPEDLPKPNKSLKLIEKEKKQIE